MRANDWLYAIGDVNGRALLTHMGKYQARVAADVILGEDGRCLPSDGAAVAARDLHRPAGRGRRLHARRAPSEAGLNVRAVDVPTQSTPGAASTGATTPAARPGSWSTRTAA